MRRLLLITNYFPPCAASATHRCLAMARHLPKYGWDVTVIAPPEVRWEATDTGLTKLVPASVKVHYVNYPKSLWARIAGRYFPSETWLPVALPVVKKVIAEVRPDVILSTSPPGCVHWLARKGKAAFGTRWVADMRDPWVTNVLEYERGRLDKWIDSRAEAAMLREADLVVTNTPSTLRGLKSAFPDIADKFAMVTNGFDPLPQSVAPSRGKPYRGGDLTLVHAGEFYLGRDPRTLIKVLSELNASMPQGLPRFRLRLLGRLGGALDIEATIRDNNANLVVETPGQVSYADVHAALTAADILISVQGPGAGASVPAKLYEYLAFNKPILQLAEPGSDMEWVLKTAGACYRMVEQTDAQGIRDALIGLATTIVEGNGGAGDPVKVLTFSREVLMGRLAEHLDALIASPSKVSGSGRRELSC